MKLIAPIAAILTWLGTGVLPVHAGAHVPAPCTAYWDAEVVFVGRVQAVNRSGTVRIVSFAVLEDLRGAASSTVDVSTGPPGQSCNLPFRVGHEYFVYADRQESPSGPREGGLAAVSCTRSRRVEDAGADLAYARELEQGTAHPGYISGQVLIRPRDLWGRTTGPGLPATGITVTITGGGATDSVVTDAAGAFRVGSRGPGSYQVRADVPDRFYSDAPARLVTLPDLRACANADATFHDNGHLFGRVVDAAGRPLAGLTIELGSAPTASTKPAGRGGPARRTVTGRDGRYTLAQLPPGRFVLSIPAGPPGRAERMPRIYLPGVETLAASARFSLGSGERASLPDFRIPGRHRFLAVSGVVFDASGRPAEDARVYLKGARDDDRIVSEPVAVDFMGAFLIAARAGAVYQLFAERFRSDSGSTRVESSDPVTFTAGDGLRPIRLTLERRY